LSTENRPNLGKLGFGIAGPHGSALFPAELTDRLIKEAIAIGVCFFDTSPAYGHGETEKRLGDAIKNVPRDRLFVTTKGGLNEEHQRDFSPEGIAHSLRRSLDRMEIDFVDGFFLHGPDPTELSDDLFRMLDEMRAEGSFRFLGVAGRGNELDAALATGKFDMMMLPMGPDSLRANHDRALAAQSAGVTVIGIEMISHTRPVWRLSLHPGDLWHMARTLLRGSSQLSKQSSLQALQASLEETAVDVVLTSTSRENHVKEWGSLLDEERAEP